MLLERVSVPLPRVLEQMGCLQAQYAPSMYIGLWSRVEGFERDALTRALETRKVVQGTLMRTTIHLVSAADYWPLAVAVRQARRDSWLKAIGSRGVTAHALGGAAGRLRDRLREGPVRRAELDAIVGKGNAIPAGLWLDLVRVPPSGTWERRRADLYAPAEDWLGPPSVTGEAALDHLVRRYLTGFGPATVADIADWGGLHPSAVTPVLERIELRPFGDERGQILVDLPRARLPDPDTPAPVRFLPTWDAMLLAHARRTGALPEEHRARILHVKAPQSFRAFLVEGPVSGSGRHEDGGIELSPFGRLDPAR